MDFTRKKRCMQAGIEAARKQVTAIKRAISAYYTERGGVPPPQFQLPQPEPVAQ